MRLSDVLSKPITTEYVQVEGFLSGRKLKTGSSKKIAVGKVALNYTVEELVENSVLVSEFFTILDETDSMILKYVLSGYTQKEIAEEMDFANHSVVSKHMKKIRKMYLKFDPDCRRK